MIHHQIDIWLDGVYIQHYLVMKNIILHSLEHSISNTLLFISIS